MTKNFFAAASFMAVLLLPAIVQSQTPPAISLESLVTGLSSPVDVVNAHDGTNRLFVVQQGGIIKVLNGSTATDFINLGASGANIISTNASERGLLSMAFHPGFNGSTNRFFYVYYTDVSGNIAISRFTANPSPNQNTADVNSGLLIITIPHPTNSNHNG